MDLTVLSIPVHLPKRTRFDLTGLELVDDVAGYDLIRFLVGAKFCEDIARWFEPAARLEDSEVGRAYSAFSNRPAELNSAIERVKPSLLRVPNGAFRLDLPSRRVRHGCHSLKAVFRGRISQPDDARRLILATIDLARVLREEMA